MEIEYKKDLHHSYMVIKREDLNRTQTYCLKILKYQNLNGILHLEQRTMDNEVSYYFDITAKQSLSNLYEKNLFTCEKVKKLLQYLILTIENAYEYLFIEDDFMITPELVYIDVASGIPYLCYLPGYAKSIQEQMVSFIEYIMNKVDYNDKSAVLLVYSLYGACREEGYTLDHLMDILNGQGYENLEQGKAKELPDHLNTHEKHTITLEKSKIPSYINQSADDVNPKTLKAGASSLQKPVCQTSNPQKNNLHIPVMKERLEGEEEIPCYALKTYLYTAISIIFGIIFIGFCLSSRIIYNAYGNQMDYMKLFALLLLTFCMEAYLLKKIWAKKNQITKIITKKEYINPISEGYHLESGIKEFGLNEAKAREGKEPKSNIKSPEHKRYNQKISDQKISNKYEQKEFDIKNIYNQIREHMELIFNIDKADKKGDGKRIIEDRKKDNERTVGKRFMQDFKNSSLEEGYQKTSYESANRNISDNYKNSLPRMNDNLQSEKQEKLFIEEYNSIRGNENHLYSDQVEEEARCDHPTCVINSFISDQNPDNSETDHIQESEASIKKIILKPLDEVRYEDIVINEFPFFIGKLKQNVDYCLEKDVISRYHAKISKEQERYYITDLNSRNGTFINDSPVETYQSMEIQNGDIISFANIKYLFMQQEA